MGFFRASDIDSLIAATGGVDVTLVEVGAVTVKGLVDTVDESLLQDGTSDFQGQSTVVTVKTGAIATLAVGKEIIVDGVHYRVMRFRQTGDGALTEVNVALI